MTAMDPIASRPDATTSRYRPTSVRWRICALMTLASFIAYILRTNMSVAGAPMASDLGLSHLQLGIILSAWAWGYAAFQFPGGVAGDRIGGRRAIAALALLWGLLNLLVALVPGRAVASAAIVILALMVLRFFMGVAQAPLFPVIGGRMVACWFPVSGWALPNSLQNVGLTFGAAATGPLIAWLTERTGWRASFALTAPLGFLLAATWWWYVRDRPSEHPAVNAAEVDLIDEGRATPVAVPPERGGWRVLLGDRQVQVITAGYFCANFVFYFFFNWLFIYLIEGRGFRLLEGGWYAAIPWIAGAGGAFLGGWLCDRLWKRVGARYSCRILGAAGMALSGVFLFAAAGAASPAWAVVLLALCLAAEQLTDAIYWAAMIAVGGRHVSAACGVMNTGGNISNGIVALVVPLMVDRLGWAAAVAGGAAFAFIAAALWLVTAADRPVASESAAIPAPVVA
jgi:ACS family glucarate transporter-like MFS transporter